MRILIIKTSSLGDLFHALPAVHLLKTGLDAEIDWVVNGTYVPLVECFTGVDRVISFPRKELRSKGGAFLSALRATEYDLIIDAQGLLKSALIAKAARGKKRLGPSFHREGAHLFYDEVVGPRNKTRHAVDENLDILRFLSLPDAPVEFPVTFPLSSFVSTGSEPNILLSPCSRHEAKNWPVERFAETGAALHRQLGAALYVSGVPDDAEACRKLERLLPPESVHNLCGKTSLVELGSLLQAMQLVLTVDSGPMHMAAAAGTPTLAVFGPTDPLRVGPFGPQHRVVRKAHPEQYSKQDLNSIRAVSVDDVLAAAMKMLV